MGRQGVCERSDGWADRACVSIGDPLHACMCERLIGRPVTRE
jgi:hypothetical protein